VFLGFQIKNYWKFNEIKRKQLFKAKRLSHSCPTAFDASQKNHSEIKTSVPRSGEKPTFCRDLFQNVCGLQCFGAAACSFNPCKGC
jgi:hypothetical protein